MEVGDFLISLVTISLLWLIVFNEFILMLRVLILWFRPILLLEMLLLRIICNKLLGNFNKNGCSFFFLLGNLLFLLPSHFFVGACL